MKEKNTIHPIISVLLILSIIGIFYILYRDVDRQKKIKKSQNMRNHIMNNDERARDFFRKIRDMDLSNKPKEINILGESFLIKSIG